MAALQAFHEAASVHVDADPDRVATLLSRPSVLRFIDPRLKDVGSLDVVERGRALEVRAGELELAFRMEPEDGGTRLAAMETVRTASPLEATKHILFPGRQHRDLFDEMRRLGALLEDLDG